MIYADNAATTFPKPQAVINEMKRAVELYGANPGRSGHYLSRKAEETVFACREAVATMFNGETENVVFTQNATHALNTAILGCANKLSHIIISDLEHNALYRPAYSIGCEISILCTKGSDNDVAARLKALIKENTAFIAVTAASNVSGERLPIEKIGKIANQHKIPFIVDASQGAGHFSIDIKKCNINILCASGHKGLFGAQGSGFMLLNGVMPKPIMFGGTGSLSIQPQMPEFTPDRYEAGTINTPAIASLGRGIAFVKSRGINNISNYEASLAGLVRYELSRIKNIRLVGNKNDGGIVSFNINNIPSETVALALSDRGVMVRGGLHCAPLAHKKYGTLSSGAVRISFSSLNTEAQAKKIIQIIKKLI